MRKFLFLSLFTLLCLSASAQYLRLAKEGRTWYTFSSGMISGYTTEVKTVAGDTLINGNRYSWLVSMDSSLVITDSIALIKEDTLNGKVDIFSIDSASQITDTTSYDFSLVKGDTVHAKSLWGASEVFVVDSVFTMMDFNNVQRKVIWLAGADPMTWCHNRSVVTWIEGIGSVQDLINHVPICQAIVDIGVSLSCVFDNGIKIYGNGVADCFKMSAEDVWLKNVKIYPNPARHRIYIQSDLPITQVRLCDLQGRLVFQQNEPSGWLDISALKPGIFILEVIDQDGKVGRRKLLKE